MKKIVAGIISLSLIFLSYKFHLHNQRESRVRTALNYAHLAPLPLTATYVEVDTEGSLFSRTFWLTFQANDAEINAWLTASPRLVRIPTSQLMGENPEWFAISAIPKQQTEVFESASDNEDTRGMIWVDRDSKKVYIKTSHG